MGTTEVTSLKAGRVEKAVPSDVGHGRIRVDTSLLGLNPGDIVEVKGERTTSAVVWRLQQDDDPNTFRMDGITRRNAGVSQGDEVTIQSIKASPCTHLVVKMVGDETDVHPNTTEIEGFVRRGLNKRPVSEGDRVFIPGTSSFDEAVPYEVISTVPKEIVQVVPETRVALEGEEAPTDLEDSATVQDLASIGDVTGLIITLREGSSRQKREAAELLGMIGDIRVPALTSALGDRSQEVRVAAYDALLDITGRGRVKPWDDFDFDSLAVHIKGEITEEE